MRHLFALLGVVVYAGAGLAAQQPAPARVPLTVRGAYRLHFRMKLATALPNGATITCKARIAPQTSELGRKPAYSPAETATGVATLNGTMANCAVEIPFAWTVADAHTGVALSYQIFAVKVAGPAPVEIRTGEREQMALAYPPEGGMAKMDLNVTF